MISGNDVEKLQVQTEEPQWHPTFQLKYLVLRDCNLNSQSLSLSPTFLLSQYELNYIDIAHNQLVGSLPLWLLHNNSKLQHLDFSGNSFTGTLQLPTWKLNLNFFFISSNKLRGQLPKDMGHFLPEVIIFNLSKNSFEGNLPLSMQQMSILKWLDLSNNKFYGNLKISIFNGMPMLQVLLLANNNFNGSMEGRLKNNQQLAILDISNNMITDKIPIWIGSLKYINYVKMSKNHFHGELPREIFSLQRLELLDVSENQLVGGVPCCLTSSMVYLYMQENYLSGTIPHALLSAASSLKILDLSFNNFSGHISNWLDNCTSLQVLLLKENKLQGPIPQQLCQVGKISIMDLSNNRFSGSIPSCLSSIAFGVIEATLSFNYAQILVIPTDLFSTDITHSDFESGAYISPQDQVVVVFTTKHRAESYKSYILDHMSGLDLSGNNLTGKIPKEIGDLVKIHALNFSHNMLVGPIPKEFSNLMQIESLDLSNNLLSGNIPLELAGLDSLAIFNVSYNNLSGMIPLSSKFSSYPESSYYGNPHLCGLYVEHKRPSFVLPPTNQPRRLEEEHEEFIDLEAFCWSLFATYIVILLGFVAVLYINPQWRRAWFYFIEDCCSYACKCLS